jgi:predicted methyltransferase
MQTRRIQFSAIAALTLFTVVGCGGAGGHHGHGPGHGHGGHGSQGFKSPEEWAQRFDDPARAEWQKPDAVVRHLELSSNSTVAEIGAGTGYWVVRIAPEVPVGKVYAVDIEPSMVEYTTKRAATLGFKNVEGVVGAPDDPKLPAAVEVLLLVDTYHHIADRTAYFKRLRDKLAPGGRLVIVDYKVDPAIPGPPQEMRLTPDAVVGELEDAGFRLKTRSEGALPRQYILIFTAG